MGGRGRRTRASKLRRHESVPLAPCPPSRSMIPKVGTGFRKRSCSTKEAERERDWKINSSRSRVLRPSEPLRRQAVFQTGHVAQEPLAGKAKKIDAELRIVEIKLPHFVVPDTEHLPALRPLHCFGSVIFRCEQAELAENFPGAHFLVEGRKPVTSGDGDEHFLGDIA